LGPSAIISHDELNWRLVRPNQPSDIGPVHADKWFWDAGYGYGSMPAGFDRFKVWMAIHTQPGANGLCVKPESHRRDWNHHFEEKDGVRKPVFDEDPAAIGMELLPLAAGEMVMFHDQLLHGGVVNRGSSCRISIELTVLFDRKDALRRSDQLRGELATT
jgi:ectoine hydroxylase-related dioxygenase (phytanoyl-CoA dioxygenase family)